MAVSRRLRFEVLRRDGHTCRYCGAQAPDVPLTVDHVIPVALGGGDDPTNLVTACQDCNAGKSSTSPDDALVADVDASALLFARAVERATEMHRAELDATSRILDEFEEEWNAWQFGSDDNPVHADLPIDWRSIVGGYIAQGLTLDDLVELTDRSMSNRRIWIDRIFRYFCGCCKNRIADRQEMARQLIEDGEV